MGDLPDTPSVTPILIEDMGITKLNAQDVCRDLFDRASTILIRDGEVVPMVFLFTDKICYTIDAQDFFQTVETKDMLSFLLRKAAEQSEIIGIALVMEGWGRPATETEQRTGVKDDNRPVKEHPNRQEILITQCEWQDSSQYMLTGSFNKESIDGIDAIKIEDPGESITFEGRFSNVFPPTRSCGYFN